MYSNNNWFYAWNFKKIILEYNKILEPYILVQHEHMA